MSSEVVGLVKADLGGGWKDDLITKLTRFILSLMGIRPLLFSDKRVSGLSISLVHENGWNVCTATVPP
jgi:hypothetical protein